MQKWGSSLPQLPQTAGDWTIWFKRSLLVPIFHCPHVPILSNNLRFHTDGIQLPLSSWITKKIGFSLFCWLEELTSKAWYYPPGYFLPHFVEEIGEDNPKPASNGHMLHESDHPACLWRNGPKAPGCPLHWDQLCSCQGWRDHTLSRCFNAEVRHCTQRLAPAVQGAAWAHHELLSRVSFCDSSLCWRARVEAWAWRRVENCDGQVSGRWWAAAQGSLLANCQALCAALTFVRPSEIWRSPGQKQN